VKVESVIHENVNPKQRQISRYEIGSSSSTSLVNGQNGERKSPSPFASERLKLPRPSSMCEPRVAKKEVQFFVDHHFFFQITALI
jgi:hypothetical protein